MSRFRRLRLRLYLFFNSGESIIVFKDCHVLRPKCRLLAHYEASGLILLIRLDLNGIGACVRGRAVFLKLRLINLPNFVVVVSASCDSLQYEKCALFDYVVALLRLWRYELSREVRLEFRTKFFFTKSSMASITDFLSRFKSAIISRRCSSDRSVCSTPSMD